MYNKKKKEFVIPFLYIITDITAIELSFFLAYWLRFYSPLKEYFEVVSGFPPFLPYLFGSLIVIPIWLVLFNSSGLYNTRRIINLYEDVISLLKVITFGMFVILSVAFFYRDFSFSRLVFILIYFNSIVLILSGRWIVIKIEQFFYIHGKQLKNVLIIGSNKNAQYIYSRIKSRKKLGMNIVGYCSDEKINSDDFKYICRLDEIRKVINSENVDMIIAVLSLDDHSKLFELIRKFDGLNIEFMYIPDIIELMHSKIKIKTLSGIPFLTLKEIPISMWNRFVKRIFDIIFSLFFLIVTFPVSLLLALLIKIESRGPIFYHQERVGLEGKIFKLIKFRSMKNEAEIDSGPVWAKSTDERTTRIGKFLRRFSIDEIPQFVNVLKGDMSVVGPRPERPFFVEQFKDSVPKYLERHCVKTGITGWAQVNGLRGNTPLEERIRYDIYYLDNWSLLFDMVIIFKTIKEIFFGRNAY